MSDQEGNRNNPYTFDDFLLVRNRYDYYQDDPFFQALVKKYTGSEFSKIDQELRELSQKVSFRFRDLADEANRLENRAKVTHVQNYDAFRHRIDKIVRCMETETLEREVFNLGLFDPKRNTPWSRFCKMFLLYQVGEAGVMCPVACTHGMVELMQRYEDTLDPEAKKALADVRDGINGEYSLGSQFVSEIQGGSDVPANLCEAVFEEAEGPDGISHCWRIYGQKFFCSAIQADYAVVTAKPKNTKSSTRVAVFAVPMWLPGNKGKEIRNSYTIDRLKPKMGTAELPTAELTYNGAVAYQIGPLEQGLANVVGIVLTISRLHVAFGGAAAGLRCAREAAWYAQFRTAFGVPVAYFPLMKNQLDDLDESVKRGAAGAFKVYGEYIDLGEDLVAGIKELEKIKDLADRKRRFRLRELVLLQKITVAWEGPALIRLAISFFGGHGIMDVPKDTAQLDLTLFEIQGGFRGFTLVPSGAHYVSVKDDGKMVAGTWVFAPPEDAVVRVYDSTSHLLLPDTPENALNYRDLALGGAMIKALIPVMLRDEEFATRWEAIVRHIKAEAFPPALHAESPISPPAGAEGPALEAFFSTTFKSRIEQAFLGTHGGNVPAFLAEFEFAFASTLVQPNNDVAAARWRHLLQAIYNAGDRFMTAQPDLFPPLVDIIIAQLKFLGEDTFTPESVVSPGAQYLAEDLVDTGIAALVEKGHTFEKFLSSTF